MQTATVGKVHPTNRITENQVSILLINGLLQRVKKDNRIFLTWKRN